MEKVSIIVPIFNAEKTLRNCINSLIGQTYRNLDIILVDDGSTDQSGKICDKFAGQDLRIRVLHKVNEGVAAARKAGIELISEEGYTTFCDADDLMARDAVEKLYHYGTIEQADLVCGTLQRFFSCSIKIRQDIPPSLSIRRSYNKEQIITKILPSFFGITDFPGYMPTKLYKNSILKEALRFEYPKLNFQEDIAFNLQIILMAEKIAVMPDVIYYYRMGGGTSRYIPTFLEDSISLYKFKMRIITDRGLSEYMRYTASIELKNECSYWLQMQFEYMDGKKQREKMLTEIERCCNIPEIREAVKYPKGDESGIPEFRNMVQNLQYAEIYNLIAEQANKRMLRTKIKHLVTKL